jgi:hypothetical protein
MSLEGLPHSGIFGSKPVCGSPKLFAAYHALHRLLAPRHSPYALSSLTIRTLDTEARRLRTPGSRLQAMTGPELRNPRSETLERQLQECTLRVCGRKTTVAKYSVVKEPASAVNTASARQARSSKRGLLKSYSVARHSLA